MRVSLLQGVSEGNPVGERVLHWQPTGLNPLDDRDDFSGPAVCQFPFPVSLISTFLKFRYNRISKKMRVSLLHGLSEENHEG